MLRTLAADHTPEAPVAQQMIVPVDYDKVAATYDNRYTQSDYAGVQSAIAAFIGGGGHTRDQSILEVGCGTGHWLTLLRPTNGLAVGVDLSDGMLRRAQARLPDGLLVRGQAERLPFATASFGRVSCINALHHFSDPAAFLMEARRVLRRGGGLLTVGLDPHTGTDGWWIYDYFPGALVADRRRYLPAKEIRLLMERAGFSSCETREVQHLPREVTVEEALRAGFLSRTHTSQLMVISDAEYEAGVRAIQAASANAPGETILRADLRLYGTIGWAA